MYTDENPHVSTVISIGHKQSQVSAQVWDLQTFNKHYSGLSSVGKSVNKSDTHCDIIKTFAASEARISQVVTQC